jgi:hypothetical protein
MDVRVKVFVPTATGDQVVYGRSTAISEGGMGVTLAAEVTKGSAVAVVFKLPGEDAEQTYGARVAYRMGSRHGVEFRGLLPEQREQLRAFARRVPQAK